MEGIDFRIRGKERASPEQIGHKALAVNLSDIAAMGGKPLAFVAAIGIPKRFSQAWIERVARGMISLARQFKICWVGGDISRSDKFFVSIALLGEGETREIVSRKGAKPGDLIYVTGKLGGSIQRKHLVFTPRIREGRYLAGGIHPNAMIDLSDGFIQDLGHILSSSHVGARVTLDQIPISEAARDRAKGSEKKALMFALSDGEDFELLFTVARNKSERLEKSWARQFPAIPLTRVGEITFRSGRIEWARSGKSVSKLWFRKKGFAHF